MELGQRMGQTLPHGTVIALIGDLGVGKTHFVQGFARGLGITEPINSPTFTLVSEHDEAGSRMPLYHMDAYRLETAAQFLDSGLDEYFSYNGITIIEWANLVMAALPSDTLTIRFHRQMLPLILSDSSEGQQQIEIPADDEMRQLDISWQDNSPHAAIVAALIEQLETEPIQGLEQES